MSYRLELTAEAQKDLRRDGLSIQFYADDAPVLHPVSAEVRGNGDPRPPLAALCAKRGWSVVDLSTGSPVDLSATANPTEWDRFRNWRDRAMDELRGTV